MPKKDIDICHQWRYAMSYQWEINSPKGSYKEVIYDEQVC